VQDLWFILLTVGFFAAAAALASAYGNIVDAGDGHGDGDGVDGDGRAGSPDGAGAGR
jgi:hypothetical protein